MLEIEIPQPMGISDLLLKVGIPEKYVFIVEKEGKSIEKESVVNNEDEISLIPFISGG